MEEKLLEFIKTYNGFKDMAVIENCLKMKTRCVSIKSVEYEPVVKSYLDGSYIKQCIFVLCLKGERAPLSHRQVSDAGLMEGFKNWVEMMNISGKFPSFGQGIGIAASDIKVSTPDMGSKVYSVRVKYIYYSKIGEF